MDRRLKFRQVEVFVEIIRRGSLKSAAEHLNLTQPAISKTLRELETHLGAPLLVRDRGGVALTREGAVFLQFAQMSIAALSQGLDSLEAARSGAAARLAVGALPSVAAKLLPEAVRIHAERAPGALLHLEDGPHGYLTSRLRDGALDMVVGRLGAAETMTGLSFTQLYSEHVLAVVAPDHPLTGTGDMGRIGEFPVVYPSEKSAIRPLVDRAMIAMGAGVPPQRIESVSGAFGRNMAMGEARAVWFISHGVAGRDLEAGRLVALPLDLAATAGPVGIMMRAEEEPMPAQRLLRQSLVDAVAALRLN
ncbi:pca operon transcription factor PcaQ [Limimaricola sp. G21655-S1]|uniref:pca operon transcription factor PcaQ n=1 Tax=Limimaricola sp. G21655-S1 TaxID=3014768 RepID=UPI0022AF8A56|nr:pca operon transcription factor PcaQ [Limimaricola sp. G21655-S1]MCZ4260645.1 pca operon transcription factor PcaQ [Limimaricola sp. G21655-S1]